MEPGEPDDNAEMGQKKKPTALGKHRAAMRAARADLRRAENEAWAWESMYAMLTKVITRAADALVAGKTGDDL
jgi:hypothetical protein